MSNLAVWNELTKAAAALIEAGDEQRALAAISQAATSSKAMDEPIFFTHLTGLKDRLERLMRVSGHVIEKSHDSHQAIGNDMMRVARRASEVLEDFE